MKFSVAGIATLGLASAGVARVIAAPNPVSPVQAGLEERQTGSAISGVAAKAGDVISGTIETIRKDKKREDWVKLALLEFSDQAPCANIVICQVKHHYEFDGEKDKDWIHQHHEVDIKLGGTIGFEIYLFTSGTFYREGDGGWINWGYDGKL